MTPDTYRPAGAGVGQRIALAAIVAGAIAVVLASSPYKSFELDRFFVPKEIALHAAALVAAIACLAGIRTLALSRVDTLLAAFATLSLVSAVFAGNHWLAGRALAITLSSLAVFACARSVAGAGMRRALLAGLALACVLGVITSLAQAYGFTSDYFTLSRAPGGTFGNRNFMAHLAAIGAPIIIWYAITARSYVAVALCTLGSAITGAGLFLSRTRAAWLALLIVGVVVAIPMWRAAHRVSGAHSARRLVTLGIGAAVGIVLALALPNKLNWKSDSPYLDTVRGVVDYNNGSGHGRIVQYRNTLHVAMAHPILGTGPGNWSVVYPRFAKTDDPSLMHDDPGLTANPWPSSDWMALVAERGIAAVLLLVIGVIGIVVSAFQAVRGSSANNPAARDPFLPIALVAVVLVTATVGAFDAVLLLAAPSLIVWAALGAMSQPGRTRHELEKSSRAARRGVMIGIGALALALAASIAKLVAMNEFGAGNRLTYVRHASYWDPGSYRIQTRLAELSLAAKGCKDARGPATRAANLAPTAAGPRALLRRCR